MTYPTNDAGMPVFPTDAEGNEYAVTNQRGRPVYPTDRSGRVVFPATDPPTAVPTNPRLDAGRASGSSGSGDDAAADATTLVAVIVVASLMVLLAVVGATVYFVHKSKQSRGGGMPAGFENPMYAVAEPAAGQASVHGTDEGMYAEVTSTAAISESSGYMDISPSSGPTEDAEEDV